MAKSELGKIKNINSQMLGSQLVSFWNRSFKSLVVLLFLGVAAFGGYLWYFSVYNLQWSEEEKKAFLSTQSKEADLKIDVLDKIINRIGEKENRFNQETISAKNIFKPY